MFIDKWLTLNGETNKALYFHNKFSLYEKPEKVVLVLSTLGWAKTFINGKELSNDEFLFGWRDYTKSAGIKEFDITKFVSQKNAIGIIVGKGWACGQIGWGNYKKHYGLPNPCAFVKINVFYSDHIETINNDGWKVGFGSITENDIFDGETQDYRKELKGFSEYSFNDIAFKKADIFFRKLKSVKENVAVTVQEYLQASVIKNFDNKNIYDFNQNFSGFVLIKCKVIKDSVIEVRHAELLNNFGELYTENLRGVKATDKYVLPKGNYVLRPYFTYHGFRYCEISFTGNVEIKEVLGCALYARMRRKGTFVCSNPILNKLYQNILWSQKSNFNKIPTDCPQRNERLGWLADIGVFARSACYNYDCKKYLDNYISIISEAIDSSGAIPCIAPFCKGIVDNAMGASAWADSFFSLIDDYYEMYGDSSLIRKYFVNMTRFLSWVENNSIEFKRNTYCFSDWLSLNANYKEGFGDVEPTLFDLCFYAIDCLYLIKFCRILSLDENIYTEKYNKAKEFFVSRYENRLSTLSGKQCSVLLSYRAKFVSSKTVCEYLVRDLELNKMTCGFIGTKFILQTLSDIGRADLCYKLLTNVDYPSWGYSIVNGATTIWERWDSYTKKNGVNKHGMNSFNHFAFGSVLEWFYSGILGINPELPGFNKILIKPMFDFSGNVNFASGSYVLKNNRISVLWKFNKATKEIIFTVNYARLNDVDFDFSGLYVEKSNLVKNKITFYIKKDKE